VSKHNQRIPVGNLRPGMYVVKLDRPWLSTPFDPQGFPISSAVQVKLLARYCKAVYVQARNGARPVARVKKALSATRRKPTVRKLGAARARRKAAPRAR
jgi:hypothetical protein